MERLFFAIACTLIHVPSIIIRYTPFREIVTPQQRRHLIILYLLTLVLSGVVYYLLPDDHLILYHKLMLLLVAFLLSGINVLLIPGHWREHWFTAGLASVHITVTFFTAAYLVLHFGNPESPEQTVSYSAAVTLVLFVLFIRFYCNCARRVVTPFLQIEHSDYWKRLWYIPLGLFFIGFFSTPLTGYSGSISVLLCRLALLLTTVAMCNTISDDYTIMCRQVELTEQLGVQQEYYHDLTERVTEARKSRHDFKHHMAAIRKFIDTDDKSGLTAYWEELQFVLHHDIEIPYTGNPALDGVLYRYAVLARPENIRFQFNGMVEPLVMPDTDLCVLLGNALDNALAGCMTIPSGRFITVNTRIAPGSQSLLIVNSYDGVMDLQDDQILSRKRNHLPGIGLDSIRAICDKNDAVMDIRYDEKTFSLLLVIPTKESAE